MSEETKLADFNWQEEDDFFGITKEEEVVDQEQEVEESEEEEEEVVVDDKTSKKKKEKEEEESEESVEFFEDETGDESEESEQEVDEEEEKPKTSIYDDLYQDLKNNGILTVDLEEDETLDADKFFELSQEDIQNQVNQKIEGLFEEMDEDAKTFLKFKRDGGRTEDFFKVYSQGTTALGAVDIEKEIDQDKVIRYQLEQEGWDAEDINDRIEYLTENGRKKKFAQKYFEKIEETEEQQRKATVKQQEQRRQALEQQKIDFKNELNETLKEAKEVKGFKFADKEKKELLNFLTQEKYPVSKTRSITGFQKELGEALKDKDKLLVIAKLLKSDFDMTDFSKEVTTKKTRKIKSKLEQRSGLRPQKSGSSHKGKTLAELF